MARKVHVCFQTMDKAVDLIMHTPNQFGSRRIHTQASVSYIPTTCSSASAHAKNIIAGMMKTRTRPLQASSHFKYLGVSTRAWFPFGFPLNQHPKRTPSKITPTHLDFTAAAQSAPTPGKAAQASGSHLWRQPVVAILRRQC